VLLSQGIPVVEAVRKLGIAEQTYYRWKKEYGGLDKTQAGKLKELEKENLQLKKLVADLSLDNTILKELLSKKRSHPRSVVELWNRSSMCWRYPSGGPVGC
jgi:transposase-like protein